MIRSIPAFALIASLAAPATVLAAQQRDVPPEATSRTADAATTAGLNDAVTQHNAAIAARNAAADTAYQAELARFHEAQAANDRARADAAAAADAYRASRAAYEAELAQYRTRQGAPPAAVPKPRKPPPRRAPHCETQARTGSLLAGRVCAD